MDNCSLSPQLSDNSPVFFTGLANSKVDPKKISVGENLNDSSHSISPSNRTSDYKVSSPNKTTLLPSPNIVTVSKLILREALETVKALSNTPVQASSKIAATPKRKLDDCESTEKAYNSRDNASPYPKRRVLYTPDERHSYNCTPKIPTFPHQNIICKEKFQTPNFEPAYSQLTSQMWKVFHQNRQTEEVFMSKMRLRDKLHEILRDLYPNCGLYVVGSSMTRLGAKSSDIDMCLMLTDSEIDQRNEALDILYNVRRFFRRIKFLHNVQVIPAKVPIIKFYDSVSYHEVDLNINNAIGIRNTHLLSTYARMDERVPPLVVIVKLWARSHDINDAKTNSLSSYSLVLMVIHFLQYRCRPPVLPSIQELEPDKYNPHNDVRNLKLHEDLPNFITENNQNLGELFLGFLQYFSTEFNFEKDAISVRLGTVIPREVVMQATSPKNNLKFVCIEEPFSLLNTALSVFNENVFRRIRTAFMKSWTDLNRTRNLFSVLKVP